MRVLSVAVAIVGFTSVCLAQTGPVTRQAPVRMTTPSGDPWRSENSSKINDDARVCPRLCLDARSVMAPAHASEPGPESG